MKRGELKLEEAMAGGFSRDLTVCRSERRRQRIRDHYRLYEDDERGLWVAISLKLDGVTEDCRFEHVERANVIRLARAYWGHFNFREEAEEFSRIFPPLPGAPDEPQDLGDVVREVNNG